MAPSPAQTPTESTSTQTESNRRNAKHSTGPRTHEGKQRVRLNSLRHGLTGQATVMPWEDRQAHDKFCANILNELKPGGAIELQLANSIAEDYWRVNRIRAIEENIFALGSITHPLEVDAHPILRPALTQAQTFLTDANSLNLLTLYQSRITRNIAKNTAQLKQLQAERQVAAARELEEAMLLAQLNESKGLPYEPAADGFAFSKAFIDQHVDRNRRLHEARSLLRPTKKIRETLKKAA